MNIGQCFQAAHTNQTNPSSFAYVISNVIGAEWSINREIITPDGDTLPPVPGRIRVSGTIYTLSAYQYGSAMEPAELGKASQVGLQLAYLEPNQIMANVNRPSSQSPGSPSRFKIIRFRNVIFGTAGTKETSRMENGTLIPIYKLGFIMALARKRPTGGEIKIRDHIETMFVYVNDDGSHRESTV